MRVLLLLLLFTNFTQNVTPGVADEQLANARSLFKQGKFQDAAAAYKSLLQNDKSLAPAYAGLVQSYLKLDDLSAADQTSVQAIAALPQSALISAMRGDVYFRQGLLFQAQYEYLIALKMDENCARAWLGMGKIYSAVSLNAGAKNFFTRAHHLDPDDGDAWYRWAVQLPYPESVTELEKNLAAFHSTVDEERHEREFIDLIKGIAGREIWVGPADLNAEIKLELLAPRPGVVRGLGMRVQFNNSVNATLLLDTGASWMTIPAKLAQRIGARKISDYLIEGVGGSEPANGYFAWVDKVTVAGVEFHDCVVHVTTKNNGEEDGIIGTDIFSKYLVELDFPARRLRLTTLPKASADSGDALSAPIRRPAPAGRAFSFGHLLLLPTRVNGFDGSLFVLDTGANSSSITPDLAKRVGKLRDTDKHVTGARGEVNKVFVLPNAALAFAQAPPDKRDLIAFDAHSLSQQLGTEVSGFIGFDVLSRLRIEINYRDGWVEVERSK